MKESGTDAFVGRHRRGMGLDQYRGQFRTAEGISGGRPVGGDGERDAHYPTIGTDHRRAGVTISQLGRQARTLAARYCGYRTGLGRRR